MTDDRRARRTTIDKSAVCALVDESLLPAILRHTLPVARTSPAVLTNIRGSRRGLLRYYIGVPT